MRRPSPEYTPLQLARDAGLFVRRVPVGGAEVRELEYPSRHTGKPVTCRVLELGPDATDGEIERCVRRALARHSVRRSTPRTTPRVTLASVV